MPRIRRRWAEPPAKTPQAKTVLSRLRSRPLPLLPQEKTGSSAAGGSASAKKKQQLEDAKELEDLTQAFKDAQVELDAAKEAERQRAGLKGTRESRNEAIVFSARFDDGTRFAASGSSLLGTSRSSYLSRTGLVLELRSGESVWLSYPKSVLDGGRKHELVPNGEGETGTATDGAIGLSSTTISSASSLLSTAESFRLVSPHGTIYRVSHAGHKWLMLPDGSVGTKGPGEGEWTWVDNHGVRTQRQADGTVKELEPMQCAKQYDAESGATVVTRADLTMTITYADGSTLAQHAEGSRIYTDLLSSSNENGAALSAITSSQSNARTRVTVEAPTFPPLNFTHSLRTDLRAAAESFASSASGPLSSGVQRREVVDFSVEFELEGTVLRKQAGA